LKLCHQGYQKSKSTLQSGCRRPCSDCEFARLEFTTHDFSGVGRAIVEAGLRAGVWRGKDKAERAAAWGALGRRRALSSARGRASCARCSGQHRRSAPGVAGRPASCVIASASGALTRAWSGDSDGIVRDGAGAPMRRMRRVHALPYGFRARVVPRRRRLGVLQGRTNCVARWAR